MTPDEWFAAIDPDPLLAVVDPRERLVNGVWQAPPPRPSIVYRRLRLFATACARMVWPLLPTDARSAVMSSERYAEGHATDADLRAAYVRLTFGPVTAVLHAVNAAGHASNGGYPPNQDRLELTLSPRDAARSAAYALATQIAGRAPASRSAASLWHAVWTESFAETRARQAAIVRNLFPPPDYNSLLNPEWLTTTVVAMAREMDSTGDFTAVPILADALEDAGCDAEPVLQCCRAPENAHTRGNWVVDLLLNRI